MITTTISQSTTNDFWKKIRIICVPTTRKLSFEALVEQEKGVEATKQEISYTREIKRKKATTHTSKNSYTST